MPSVTVVMASKDVAVATPDTHRAVTEGLAHAIANCLLQARPNGNIRFAVMATESPGG